MEERQRVFANLSRIAKGISNSFGAYCETLIHDMTQPGYPVVAIYNGGISGRCIGSTQSLYGEPIVSDGANTEDVINSQAIIGGGRHIKSTTMHFSGDGYHYALGINFDCTAILSAEKVLGTLAATSFDMRLALQVNPVHALDDILSACMQDMHIQIPLTKLNKPARLQLVSMLYQRKAFTIQKSVPYVAERLGISRFTLYKYIQEAEEHLLP